MNRICLWVAVTVTLITLSLIGTFGLSRTRDYYVCGKCKSLGEGRALRVFRLRIPLSRIQRTKGMMNISCKHEWRWYFANSEGILLNKENWDGPLGDYPWAEWKQEMANQASHGPSTNNADAPNAADVE